MEQLAAEIRAAVNHGAWVLALTGTLALPDICAALESENGRSSGSRYRAWIRTWLGEQYPELDPGEIYQMRCSMLHQGRTQTGAYERVIFVAPGPLKAHNNVLGDALNLDLPTFCEDVLSAVDRWKTDMEGNPNYERNSPSLIQWYPEGLAPYVEGLPVLT